jgi:hypothetical protein
VPVSFPGAPLLVVDDADGDVVGVAVVVDGEVVTDVKDGAVVDGADGVDGGVGAETTVNIGAGCSLATSVPAGGPEPVGRPALPPADPA